MTFHSRRFDRAAATYGGHAQIQERMADVLIGLLPASAAFTGAPAEAAGAPAEAAGPPQAIARMLGADEAGLNPSPDAILEMGCGTGIFTERLRARFPSAAIAVTDASPRMLEAAQSNPGLAELQALAASRPDLRWHLFDASGEAAVPETLRMAGPFDLAASSALVQWFPDLRRHFSQVASLLAPSGSYLVSGFTRDNFPELNAILREPPFSYASFPGHFRGEIESAAAAAGLDCADFQDESVAFVLPSARDFLESIRGLGSARRPDEEKPLTRSRLRYLLETYQERYPVEGGVRATWKPWYAWLRKPG
ncbi:MAG: methyltransferase domain-containing protein [Fibrobacterota bacterium]|nr:methyltransferase domain-containing protein [Fibrobacterota bacterium]